MLMTSEIELINGLFASYFSSGQSKSQYRVDVVSLNESNSKIFVNLSFLKGQTYCCSEVTCHFKADWSRIKIRAKEVGVLLAQNLSIEFNVVVENGSLFTLGSFPKESEMFKYKEIFSESASKI
jgi:hypothetical protein